MAWLVISAMACFFVCVYFAIKQEAAEKKNELWGDEPIPKAHTWKALTGISCGAWLMLCAMLVVMDIGPLAVLRIVVRLSSLP